MSSLFKLNNYVVIDLFEIELDTNEGYLRFHGSKNFEKNLIFQGKEYLFIPCELSTLEKSIDGKQTRPKLKISNINNYISRVFYDRHDLIAKGFYRKRILAKDLDAVNFTNSINPFGSSAFNTYISLDKLIINRKISENKEFIEIELSSSIDVETVFVPNRKINNDTCVWKYKCFGCNYGNTADYQGPVIKAFPSASPFPSQVWFEQSYWAGGGPDLGLPIADENDKTFLSGYQPTILTDSYNLTGIQYLGAYSSTQNYLGGHFIYVDNLSNIDFDTDQNTLQPLVKPKRFFMCVSDNTSGKYPEQNTDVWKEDKCSKTLKGCLLRFNDYVTDKNNPDKALPFGSFPATFPYENQTAT